VSLRQTASTLPQLDELTRTELRRRYEASPDAEIRTRYQMLLLSLLELLPHHQTEH
jgi:hypothetical protein